MDTKFSKLAGVDKGIMVFAYVILGLFMVAIIFPVIYIILHPLSIDYPSEPRPDLRFQQMDPDGL